MQRADYYIYIHTYILTYIHTDRHNLPFYFIFTLLLICFGFVHDNPEISALVQCLPWLQTIEVEQRFSLLEIPPLLGVSSLFLDFSLFFNFSLLSNNSQLNLFSSLPAPTDISFML